MMSAEEKIALLRRTLTSDKDTDRHVALLRVIETSWPELWHSLRRVLDQ